MSTAEREAATMARKLNIQYVHPRYDVERANDLIDEAFADRGWTIEDAESEDTAHDVGAMRAAVFEAFANNHVVRTPRQLPQRAMARELARRAVTKGELYREVFPMGPGAMTQADTPEEEAARNFLTTEVWKLCGPSRSSWVQKQAGVSGSGLVLCETKVERTRTSEETGVTEPGKDLGRFLTDSPKLILDYLVANKIMASLSRKADDIDKYLEEVERRQPAVAEQIARYAKAETRAALAKIKHADPAWVRETLALEVGVHEDDDDEEFEEEAEDEEISA